MLTREKNKPLLVKLGGVRGFSGDSSPLRNRGLLIRGQHSSESVHRMPEDLELSAVNSAVKTSLGSDDSCFPWVAPLSVGLLLRM